MTSVVNVRSWTQDEVRAGRLRELGIVYVGRAVRSWGLDASPFANPHKIDPGRPLDRDRPIRAFRQYLRAHPELVARARAELAGKRLACWCAPLACHADVLAAVVDGEDP